MTPDGRRRAGYVTLGLGAVAGVLALWAFATGGFRVYVWGIPLSVRGEHRAALVAAILAVIGFVLLDRELRLTRSAIASVRRHTPTLSSWVLTRSARLLALVVLAAAAIVLILGLELGVRAAGGSDPSGYVSQAVLWRQGDLRVRQDIAAHAPWPDADATVTPLAYRPAAGHTSVPVCAPGLPLLMALSDAVGGSCGPYVVGPVFAALLVCLTYALGVRVATPAVGAMAALAVAASPTVLFMSMSAMSDVPAAAFWTASLVLARGRGRPACAAAGVAAGIAILIRPNLAPLAAFPALMAAWPGLRGGTRSVIQRAACFGMGCLPSVVFVAWLFNDLYGSPLESGYGPTHDLFAWRHFGPNVARYPRWLWETQGPVPFLFLLAPWLAWQRGISRPPVYLLLGFIGAAFASYVFYEPFDAWWFLRFLLPAFPAIFVLAFAVVWSVTAGWRRWAGVAAAITLTAVAVHHGARLTQAFGIKHLAAGEQKYADAGRFVARHLPAHAVVLAMQHSGSIRLYSQRPVLRYDLLDPQWLDRALEHLRAEGFAPYLLLEDWEAEIFRERFANQKSVAVVRGPPMAASPDGHILIFATNAAAQAPREPMVIDRTSGCSTTD